MSISIQEISIIIAAKDLSPSILNPDFLKYSDIVPSDWQYDQQPVISNSGARISYDNGVRITSQPNRVAFAQVAPSKDQPQFLINSMAARFAEKLPNADYVAVGVNPRGLVPFFDNHRGAHEFLFHQLFAQGAWQDFGQAPAQAAIQLSYVLEQGQLNLSINEAKLKGQDGQSVSAVVFSGNFNYPVRGDMGIKRVQNVIERIQLWQSTVATFQQLVNERFLGASHAPSSQPGADIPIAPPAVENEMVL
ncbi:hypothetical protein [Acaryochloris marina]|uniref:Uncharacterized protein n=1 Tax=Acaryochloris marina (strain MBIC 11017) TaxID=329726 RepID=B0CDH0_ACAM1|nr:hypothetical protein [Acaryochloris marina]ABW26895.1 conserved hypothetical protein [Acaryochloris marina MBIC11017]BDM81667.1 hypothetical protein AM10699_45340 [Acaryochloris marina MBIC10699]